MMTPLLALFLFAGEEIVLHTGYRLPAESHEIVGDNLRIHTGSGTVEIPRSSVAAIEAVESVPSPAPTPKAPPEPSSPEPVIASKTTKDHLHDAAHSTGLPRKSC
jgi:hypothetical protein